MYITELLELLGDDEVYIRIEVLEVLTSLLDSLDETDIINEYVTAVLHTLEKEESEEIQA